MLQNFVTRSIAETTDVLYPLAMEVHPRKKTILDKSFEFREIMRQIGSFLKYIGSAVVTIFVKISGAGE